MNCRLVPKRNINRIVLGTVLMENRPLRMNKGFSSVLLPRRCPAWGHRWLQVVKTIQKFIRSELRL